MAPTSTPLSLRAPAADVLLVANLSASRLDGPRDVKRARRVLEGLGAHVELCATESLEELRTSVDPDDCPRRIVLFGGDGSLHAFANLLPCPKAEVALLPAGRANNVAASLGIPTELDAAADVAVRGSVRPIDVVVAHTDGRRYVAIEGVSAGFHALARARYHARNSSSLMQGLVAGAGVLTTFRPPYVAVDTDAEVLAERIDQLFVANLPRYSFGLRVAPSADPSDGFLDLVAIGRTGRLSLLALLARLRRGTHLDHPAVQWWRAKRVRIDTAGRSPVIADSTNLGTGRVELEVDRAALNLVVPPS